jgi:hypothetical protein
MTGLHSLRTVADTAQRKIASSAYAAYVASVTVAVRGTS